MARQTRIYGRTRTFARRVEDRFYASECFHGRHHALVTDRTGTRRCLDCGGQA